MAFDERSSKALELDDLDRRLLTLLQEDSQARYADLGKKLHLSPPAVHQRVKMLRRAGVIRHYTVDLNPASLGFHICAFVNVFLTQTTCVEIAPQLQRFPEIEECHSVTGEHCLILKVRTESPDALVTLLTALRSLRGIERTTTTMVLRTYFAKGARPR